MDATGLAQVGKCLYLVPGLVSGYQKPVFNHQASPKPSKIGTLGPKPTQNRHGDLEIRFPIASGLATLPNKFPAMGRPWCALMLSPLLHSTNPGWINYGINPPSSSKLERVRRPSNLHPYHHSSASSSPPSSSLPSASKLPAHPSCQPPCLQASRLDASNHRVIKPSSFGGLQDRCFL